MTVVNEQRAFNGHAGKKANEPLKTNKSAVRSLRMKEKKNGRGTTRSSWIQHTHNAHTHNYNTQK